MDQDNTLQYHVARAATAGRAASTMPHISTVLPVYRTAYCLPELYERLRRTLETLDPDFEIVMVEDGGPDNAWEILEGLARQDTRLKGIRLSRNFGQHSAIAAGFEHATGDVIVLMDADLQDRPEDIPLLLEQLKGDVDIVYTVKTGGREPATIALTSRLYHYVFSRLTHTSVPRDIGTFRAFTRRLLDAVLAYPERGILFGPLMFHVGFKHALVPVVHDPRHGSRTSYTFRKRLALAINSILSYTDLPHRILINAGIVILTGSALYSAAIVFRYLFVHDTVPPGLALLALLLTVTMGMMMLGFGIIGIYVYRVYQEVLARPRYIVSRSLNVTD